MVLVFSSTREELFDPAIFHATTKKGEVATKIF